MSSQNALAKMARKKNRKRLGVSIAAGAALILGLVAGPSDWDAGEGTLNVRYLGDDYVTQTVEIGSGARVSGLGTRGPIVLDVELPDGLPTDEQILVLVRVTIDGAPIVADLGDLSVTLILPDGRQERVPTIRAAEDGSVLEAVRRPTRNAPLVLGVLGLVMVLWLSEVVPLFVTSLLIPLFLVVGGVATAAQATAPFAHPIIVLFFAGFLMAEAMRSCGLDHYIATAVTAKAGRSAATLFATLIGLTAFLSMWMSNTAAAAVLIPIAVSITGPLRHDGFRKALVLGIAYAATIGGVGSAIGTPANQLAIEFLGDLGQRSLTFADWFWFGVPMVLIFVPIMGVYLWWRSDIQIDEERLHEVREVASTERTNVGSLTRDQVVVLLVFSAVMLGWLTESFHGMHAGMIALSGAVILFVLGRLKPDAVSHISWPSLLTFGGGLTLGLFIVSSGISDFIATRLEGLSGLSGDAALVGVAMVTLLLTTVASNTASAAILIPLAIPIANVLGLDPVVTVVVVAIASSVDFALVIGTPPTMIAYATRLYSAGQIFRTGAVLDLIGVLVLVFGVTRLWSLIGLL